ncbi:hypothetical protein VTI74DRAFT_6027 [Chaetomium olivicolor]
MTLHRWSEYPDRFPRTRDGSEISVLSGVESFGVFGHSSWEVVESKLLGLPSTVWQDRQSLENAGRCKMEGRHEAAMQILLGILLGRKGGQWDCGIVRQAVCWEKTGTDVQRPSSPGRNDTTVVAPSDSPCKLAGQPGMERSQRNAKRPDLSSPPWTASLGSHDSVQHHGGCCPVKPAILCQISCFLPWHRHLPYPRPVVPRRKPFTQSVSSAGGPHADGRKPFFRNLPNAIHRG